MRLGIVLPVANEEATIEPLLDAVLRELGTEDAIFCVLDRASRDRTRELVEAKTVQVPRVRLVWSPVNRCVVDAYFRGYREALDAGCEFILEMDGGFSHAPEAIPLFLRAMEEGYDYAGGCRFMPGGCHDGPLKRRAVSRGGTLLANLLLGTRMRDMTSGFECFNRRAMDLVLTHGVRSRAHFFQTEIRYLMHRLRWTEIPIRYTNPSPGLGTASVHEAFSQLGRLSVRRLRRAA